MEKFCEFLKKHAKRTINLKKENEAIKKPTKKSHEKTKMYYTCEEKFEDKYANNKRDYKVTDLCHYTDEYRGAARSMCNLNYGIFYNGSKYDCQFTIKELAE